MAIAGAQQPEGTDITWDETAKVYEAWTAPAKGPRDYLGAFDAWTDALAACHAWKKAQSRSARPVTPQDAPRRIALHLTDDEADILGFAIGRAIADQRRRFEQGRQGGPVQLGCRERLDRLAAMRDRLDLAAYEADQLDDEAKERGDA